MLSDNQFIFCTNGPLIDFRHNRGVYMSSVYNSSSKTSGKRKDYYNNLLKWKTAMASSGTSITTPAIIETEAPTNGGRERRRSSSPFGHLLHLTNGLQSGEYYIGPRLNTVSPSPVKSVSEYIAKKTDGDEFVTMKILSLSPGGNSPEDSQGKSLIHNEHSILSLLQDQIGIIQQHGLYREGNNIILVLDCLYQHEYGSTDQYKDFVNLQQYIIKERRLPEREALQLFYQLVCIVKEIHKKKIVHRDLKLANVVINKRTQQVFLTNFALGKHLVHEDDLLSDQRGSLAYVSPDVISGEPYYGMPSDMWSLGVLLYTMISGQFPYYDDIPQELFRKIKSGKFVLPRDLVISIETQYLLKELMELDQRKRLTALAAAETTQSILSRISFTLTREPVQIVPEIVSSPASEFLVPDQDDYSSTHQVNVTEMSAPRLHFTMDHQATPQMPIPVERVSPSGLASWLSSSPTTLSPMSPHTPPLFIYPDNTPSSLPPPPPPSSQFTNPFLHRISPPSSSQSLPLALFHHQPPETNPAPLDMPPTHLHNYQQHLHPHSAASHHRHSFSEGDPSSNHWLRRMLTSAPVPVMTHGRRSLGSMAATQEYVIRNRRNSYSQTFGVVGTEGPRVRRRSHEPRDSEREILQNLETAGRFRIGEGSGQQQQSQFSRSRSSIH